MKKISPVFIFLLLLIGMALFPYIPMELFHFNIDNFSPKMKVLYNFVCDIGFIIIVFLVYKDRIIKEFKSYFKNFKDNFKVSLKYYFIGLLLMIVSNNIISIFFSDAISGNEDAVRNLISKYPMYMLFSVSVYAPFIEETIFRRSIKDSILSFKNNHFTKYVYIILSGLIFAMMHIIGQTNTIVDYVYIIPYMSLGCAFASLYYKTDNLFTTIILHSLHNTLAIILYLGIGV